LGCSLSRYLERAGYETRVAADGPRALELAGDRRPDLVVLDVMLPGLDGLGMMRRLRALDKDARVPISLLTARGEESDLG
jgi:two-component system response regulator ResD